MKTYTHEEMLDRVIGEKGTVRRDELEVKLEKFLICEEDVEVDISELNVTGEDFE